ncbi:MAG: lipoprotein signal peptidase [Bacteroidales bacterium]
MALSQGKKVTLLVLLVVLLDQAAKIWIKTHMAIGQSYDILGNWFKIYFIENNGMAFGMQFGGPTGKIVLTLLRLVLIGLIAVYLRKLIQNKAPTGVIYGITLILIGAVGNVIDCTLYGTLFSESTHTQVASLFPAGGGYAPLLQGKVVDMLYFPLIETTLPNWLPFWGGNHFIFFRPIFNIADSSITIGVFYLFLFQRKYFAHSS